MATNTLSDQGNNSNIAPMLLRYWFVFWSFWAPIILSCVGACSVSCSSRPRHGHSASKMPTADLTVNSQLPSSPEQDLTKQGWWYYPTKPTFSRAYLDLQGTDRLVVGNCGQRWLWDTTGYNARAAVQLADEAFVAVNQTRDGKFVFVGDEGTVYVSETPLGEFSRVILMTPRATQVTANGLTVIATGYHQGTTWAKWSKDGGMHFQALTLPEHGPAMRLKVNSTGRAMMLDFPEKLWFSNDFRTGKQGFTQVSFEPIGARQVIIDATDRLVAPGPLQMIRWEPNNQTPVLKTDSFEPASMEFSPHLEQGPSALALLQQRASLSAATYYELAKPKNSKLWLLGKSTLAARLVWTELAHSHGCQDVKIASNGPYVVVACMGKSFATPLFAPTLQLLFSHDEARSFHLYDPNLAAVPELAQLSVLPDGTVFLSGACDNNKTAPCDMHGLHRIMPEKTDSVLHYQPAKRSELPKRTSLPSTLVDVSGRIFTTAYNHATNLPVVLFSDDGGFHFKVVEQNIQTILKTTSPHRPGLHTGTLSIGDDGTLSWYLKWSNKHYWLLLDRDGKVQSAEIAPKDCRMLAVSGKRALAFCSKKRLLQSIDGGKHFELTATLPDCPDEQLASSNSENEKPEAVFCSSKGCVVGDNYARIGWQNSTLGVTKHTSPSSNTQITCKLEDSKADVIESAESLELHYNFFHGPTDWFVLTSNRSLSEATATLAIRSDDGKSSIITQQLFASEKKTKHSLRTLTTSNGVIALRYVAPPVSSNFPVTIHFAWLNVFEPHRVNRSSITLPAEYAEGMNHSWRCISLLDGGRCRYNAKRNPNRIRHYKAGALSISGQTMVFDTSISEISEHDTLARNADTKDSVWLLHANKPVERLDPAIWTLNATNHEQTNKTISNRWVKQGNKIVSFVIGNKGSTLWRSYLTKHHARQYVAQAFVPVDPYALSDDAHSSFTEAFRCDGTLVPAFKFFGKKGDFPIVWTVDPEEQQDSTAIPRNHFRQLISYPQPITNWKICTAQDKRDKLKVIYDMNKTTAIPIQITGADTTISVMSHVATVYLGETSSCVEGLSGASITNDKMVHKAIVNLKPGADSWLLAGVQAGTQLTSQKMKCFINYH